MLLRAIVGWIGHWPHVYGMDGHHKLSLLVYYCSSLLPFSGANDAGVPVPTVAESCSGQIYLSVSGVTTKRSLDPKYSN